MNAERESRVVPAIVAVVGVVAFGLLLYLLLAGADWVMNRFLGTGAGVPI